MTPNDDGERHARLMALFEEAIAVPFSHRKAFVEQLSGSDTDLREELASLLDAHDSSADYFEDLSEQLVSPAYASVMRRARRAREAALLPHLQAEIGEKYRVLQGLGGGMSRVFLAEELKLARRVVIKVLPPEMARTSSVERFQREIQVAARLQHPHIVPVLTSDTSDTLLYYTMPFVAGESLRDRIGRDGPLPVADAIWIWRDVLDALGHAHRHGVIHGDIKPENILLGDRSAFVSDFGVARAIEAAGSQGQSGGVSIGTPVYMAPEQLVEHSTSNHRVDLYAAGLVMYEMLEGRLPFAGETAQDIAAARLTSEPAPLTRPDCPPTIGALVRQCLTREPDDRLRSAEQALAVLEGELLIAPVPASSRRSRRVGALVIAALVVVAVSLGVREVRATRAVTVNQKYTTSVEAWEWYQRGIDRALMRSTEGREQALDHLNRAIAADSNFAAAYAGFVDVYSFEAGNSPGSALAAFAKAERAANKAYALDSTLSESHVALGWSHMNLRRWKESEAALKRGLAIDPDSPNALEGLARLHLWTGRYSEQLVFARKMIEADPHSYAAIRELALALATNGRCDEAVTKLELLRKLVPRPGVAGVIAGQCHAARQSWPEALADFQWAMETRGGARAALSFYAFALARAGEADSATAILNDLISGAQYSHGAFGIATVYAGLGDYERAISWFERSVDEHTVRAYLLGPMFAELRRDERFARVRKRLGL